jgi:hypothetical protein
MAFVNVNLGKGVYNDKWDFKHKDDIWGFDGGFEKF